MFSINRSASERSRRRLLDPIDRISEVLFGLIMVLTFTSTLSVAEAGREDVKAMLVGALGCNLAWGLIDAVFYLMGCLGERGQDLAMYHSVRKTTDPGEARRLIADALPPVLSRILSPAELDSIRERLLSQSDPPRSSKLELDDWKAALGVFVLVFLSTFPVVIPFMVMPQAGPALRVSNIIAVVMLFLAGAWFGRLTGRNPLIVGVGMVLIGGLLVAMTIALGG